MRHDITYRCTIVYDGPVAESHNELRVVPTNDEHQSVLHAHVTTAPSARVLTTEDYWGTRVDAFGVRAPHERLDVLVEASVHASPPPRVHEVVALAMLGDVAFRDEHRELLDESPLAAGGERVAALVEEVAATGVTDVVGLSRVACAVVADAVVRDVEATEVGTGVEDVLELGRGACQDRTHLLVAVARGLGVPARYVSGYVTDTTTCDVGTTHAWVEVAVPGAGWHTLDPCNDTDPTDERAVIGRGRDYGDVPPLRGTYIGGDSRRLDVQVDVAPVVPVT